MTQPVAKTYRRLTKKSSPQASATAVKQLPPHETGRSLTEMLATLAIMGVLTIAAIAGVTYAINRQRANQIIHDARVGYYDEYGSDNAHPEWFRIKPLETDRPMWVFRDKLGRIYVKADSVGKDVCWHVLRMAAENILSFYNTDNTEMTSCPAEENDIVIAFNGASAPAECAVWGDCGEEFDGYCSSDGRCSTCDDNEKLNEGRTGCVCDPSIALTCTNEETSWCCGKDEDGNGLICGDNPGECINGGGACYYQISAQTQTKTTDCSYRIHAQTQTKTTDCYVDLDADGKPGNTSGCSGAGQYCYLAYEDNHCVTPAAADSKNKRLYGTCLQRTAFTSQCNVTATGSVLEINQGCNPGQYCYLAYADNTCLTGAPADAADIILYGTCLQRTAFTSQCNVTATGSVLSETQGCPAAQYCYLKWSSATCTPDAPADAANTTIYGACLARNKFSPSCPN